MTDRLANYEPVQARLGRFWADHALGRVDCVLLEHDDKHVLAKASIWRVITDEFPASVGYAAESHDGSPVNRQGWMIENAETSAIGRALANLGYAPTTARPSAEDMERATARSRRQIADSNLAQVTFDRLKTIKGTETAEKVRKLAREQGKHLSLVMLANDPEWRTQLDALLDEENGDE